MKKAIAFFLAFTLSMFIISPFANAQSTDQNEEQQLTQEEMDEIIKDIVNEIEAENPDATKPSTSGEVSTLGVASVGTKLIKIFGKGYVKSKLPKKIYSKFPASAKAKMSEEKFIGIWNTYVLMGPLDEVKDVVTDKLDPYMWHWLASSCGYIVQGVVYAVI